MFFWEISDKEKVNNRCFCVRSTTDAIEYISRHWAVTKYFSILLDLELMSFDQTQFCCLFKDSTIVDFKHENNYKLDSFTTIYVYTNICNHQFVLIARSSQNCWSSWPHPVFVQYRNQNYETKRSPMSGKTEVQFQVESYQSVKKWCLIPPCLTLSIIRYRSRVKWSNQEKEKAPSPIPSGTLLMYIYIYIERERERVRDRDRDRGRCYLVGLVECVRNQRCVKAFPIEKKKKKKKKWKKI